MLSCSCSVYTFIVFYSLWKKAHTFGRGINTVEEKQRECDPCIVLSQEVSFVSSVTWEKYFEKLRDTSSFWMKECVKLYSKNVVVTSSYLPNLALCLLSYPRTDCTSGSLVFRGQVTISGQWALSKTGSCVTSLPEHFTAAVASFRSLFPLLWLLESFEIDDPVLGDVGQVPSQPMMNLGVNEKKPL